MNMRRKKYKYYWLPKPRRSYIFTITFTEKISSSASKIFEQWINLTSIRGEEPVDRSLPLCAS